MKLALCSLVLALTACGGDASSPDAPSVPDMSPNALRIIGNSIALVPETPGEWSSSRGMASSSVDTDYAHLVAAGLNMPNPVISNFADLERNPADPINHIDLTTPMADLIAKQVAGITPRTIVVVQLSDNAPVGGGADFTANYGQLLDGIGTVSRLACVGSFWYDPAKDAIIKAACAAHGGTYVFIGDVNGNPASRDLLDGPQYDNPAVEIHPHDWSMALIAQRILAGLENPA